MKDNGHLHTERVLGSGWPVTMTHSQDDQIEISEKYVRGQLAPQDRQAFEEHFFGCDECFQQVQMTERFVAGMYRAADTGKLPPYSLDARGNGQFFAWPNWARLSFATTALASVILAASIGWLLFYRMPRLRNDLALERQAREQDSQQLKTTGEQLDAERQERAKLETQLEQARREKESARPPDDQIAMVAEPQGNVPVAILQAERNSNPVATELVLSAEAKSVVLWVEVDANSFESFRLQIFDKDNRLVQGVARLQRNKEGAVSVMIPARLLRPGKYIVKLYGISGRQQLLVGAYQLQSKTE